MIVDAPWYMPNTVVRSNLHAPTAKEEIRRYSSQYSTRLSAHPSDLVANLKAQADKNRLLRIHLPDYMATRFLA
jgi:hypothetical protein